MAGIMKDKYILGQSASVALDAPGKEIQIDLPLEPTTTTVAGANISGVVNTSDSPGAPIQGAYVKLMNTTYQPEMHAVTNANGEYSLFNIPPGEYTIFAISSGRKLQQATNITVTPYLNYTVNFTLAPDPSASLAIIAGDLTNKTTSAFVNGAVVTLLTKGSGTETLTAITYSNQYGQFVFREVAKGNYTVKITALGYETLSVPISVTTDGEIVQANEQLTPSVNVGATGTVSGIITNKTSTAPISGADVILYSVTNPGASNESLSPVAFTQTNTNGVYLFVNVPQGTYKVKADELETVIVKSATTLSYTPKFINFIIKSPTNKENSKNVSDKNINNEVFNAAYNGKNVTLKSPAKIEDDMITGIGNNSGSVSLNVSVPGPGYYNLIIKYVSDTNDKTINISINGVSTNKTYSFDKTNSMSVDDAKNKVISLFLDKTINIIKIYNE